MENKKSVMLVNENDLNDSREIDLLCAFELDDTKYVIYSKNEYDYDGNIIIYSGKINIKNDRQYVENIINDEYKKIKTIIKKMIDYNSEVSNA